MLKNIMEVNEIVAKVMFSEQFIDQNSRNAEVNDFINDVKNDLYEIQKLAQNIDNMNRQPEEIMKLMQKISERVSMAIEKMRISSPEDVNEEDLNEDNRDLIGASVFGIGGEEKLANIQIGHDGSIEILTDQEIDNIRKVRQGQKDSPMFFQRGGWFYQVRPKLVDSNRIKGRIVIDPQSKKMTKKEALEILSSYTASKKEPSISKYPE